MTLRTTIGVGLMLETVHRPGETGKLLFYPRPDRSIEPNAGILRLEPGTRHPIRNHDLAEV